MFCAATLQECTWYERCMARLRRCLGEIAKGKAHVHKVKQTVIGYLYACGCKNIGAPQSSPLGGLKTNFAAHHPLGGCYIIKPSLCSEESGLTRIWGVGQSLKTLQRINHMVAVIKKKERELC